INILPDDYDLHQSRNVEEINEFRRIRGKLDQYQSLLAEITSSKDIFASKSPSLIVIAIGATTERLMRNACDLLGIKRKSNARPTLHTYIHEYRTKKVLNETAESYLETIKNYRNRATHHFNIDWDEAYIVLNQFCKFVEWYAGDHTSEEE
ncbi:MAG: DUF4145 domain-containing protein, partial [Candidatus Poseidoniaceae archaeon]|nr:DUF4145 domain-containing protein [Candidatus Poseidoniaceae archaeon]